MHRPSFQQPVPNMRLAQSLVGSTARLEAPVERGRHFSLAFFLSRVAGRALEMAKWLIECRSLSLARLLVVAEPTCLEHYQAAAGVACLS